MSGAGSGNPLRPPHSSGAQPGVHTPPTQVQRGRLVLVPNGLDLGTGCEVDLTEVLPLCVLQQASGLSHWVVENAKSARAFLKRVDKLVPLQKSIQALDIRELPRPRKGAAGPAAGSAVEVSTELEALLAPALIGHDIGLLSEAGLPAVADPGAALVGAAHRMGMQVLPLSGPSSLMLALAASGLNGQSFAFVGYLPVEPAARVARIRELDALSRRHSQTQIAIETPYRNAALLSALVEQLQPSTRLSVASGLTLPAGQCRTQTVSAWRAQSQPPMKPAQAGGAPARMPHRRPDLAAAPLTLDDRTPAVFLWLGQ